MNNMNKHLVSIVSICWNRKQEILESLQGVYNGNYENIEVIVVDNGSTDGSADAIKEQFPNVNVIKMFKNIGIEAYNIGFKNARGKYIVILDDDSFPAKDAITRMVKKFDMDSKLGVVAFDVRNYYKYDEIAYETSDEGLDAKAESKDYLMSFNGAGAAIRRCLFESIGFYPEEFFLYWNEQDVAFKVWDKGYKISFFADVVSYHKYSPKNRESKRAPYYYTRNMFWMLWKNYPLHFCVQKSMELIFLCFYNSFEQKTSIYLKAMCDAFLKIDTALSKRKVVSKKIWKNMRVVFESSFTYYK